MAAAKSLVRNMFHRCLLLAALMVFSADHVPAAETGPMLELAKMDLRLDYDSIAPTPSGLIAPKRDTGPQEALCPELAAPNADIATNPPPREFKFAVPVDSGTVALRPIATGKAPSLRLLRKRFPSRYGSGAWLDVQSGYGDVQVEDRVGRGHMNGAGIQDPDFLYLRLCLKF